MNIIKRLRVHIDCRAARRILWWSGVVLLVGSLGCAWLVATMRWRPTPVIFFSRLVVQIEAVCVGGLVLGVACWMGSWIAWARTQGLSQQPRVPSHVLSWRSVWAMVRRAGVIAITVAVLLASLPLGGVMALTLDRYHVLNPPSPGGCRIVVEHDLFSISGANGVVYLAVPGSLALRDTGVLWGSANAGLRDYTPDYDPIDNGTWSLSWTGATAQLDLWGGAEGYGILATPGRTITCPK